jgi:hypothetical protein
MSGILDLALVGISGIAISSDSKRAKKWVKSGCAL